VVRSLGDSTAAQVDASIAGLTASGNTPFKTGMAVAQPTWRQHAN